MAALCGAPHARLYEGRRLLVVPPPCRQNCLSGLLRCGRRRHGMYHVAFEMQKGCCSKAVKISEEVRADVLAYLDFLPSHWKRLCINNVQEIEVLFGEEDGEVHDAALKAGTSEEHDWSEVKKMPRKMIESSPELVINVETA